MGLNGQDYTQLIGSNAGLRTQYGVILPPGARVAAYVRSTGIQNGDDAFIAQNLVTTLAQGLARARANMGDYVVCLPGHSEAVTDATTFSGALLAGTKIIGVGRGTNMPTFSWAATAASWVVGVTDVAIVGLRLLMAGSTVPSAPTLALSVTANDFGFYQNDVETSSASANTVTAIGVSGTASRFDISGNVFRGQLANGATSTTILVSSTGSDGRICDNEIITCAISGTGNINVSGAHTRIKILRNVVSNTLAASVAGIGFANAASSGQCAYNTVTVLNTGATVSGTTGIQIGAACTVGFFQNFVVNDVLKSGLLLPTVDT